MKIKWNLYLIPILILGSIFYFLVSGNYKLPPSKMIKIAEDYIISRVGIDYFRKNFKIADSGHMKQELGYTIVYRFIPLEQYTNDGIVTIHISGDKAESNLVPNCVKDNSLCDFKITNAEALQIAKNNGFNSSDLRVGVTPFIKSPILPFAIEITSCKLDKAMQIDYRNGKILSFTNKVICGGTP